MTVKELSILLNGRERRNEITKDESKQAKENGLVVCYGASDDLLEFEGSIYEEFGACDGTIVKIGRTKKGIKFFDEENESDIDEYEIPTTEIQAYWCPNPDKLPNNIRLSDEEINQVAWVINTDIPHETFKIYEDGELFCLGIVFHIDDLKNEYT